MKKTLIICCLILAVTGGVLSALDRDSEYMAERHIWRLNRDFTRVTRDQENLPEAALNNLVENYEAFLRKFSDSKLVPEARLRLGRVFLLGKNYEAARKQYEAILKQFPNKNLITDQAYKAIISSYVLQKDYDGVLRVYKRVLKESPLTPLGFDVPLLIVKLHLKRGNRSLADQAMTRAMEHYREIIDKYPETMSEFQAQQFLASAYFAQQKWRKGVQLLGESFIRFPEPKYLSPKKADSISKTINTVSVFQLRDPDLPISIYQKFIEAHPGHPFNTVLQRMIQKLRKVKEERKEFFIKK